MKLRLFNITIYIKKEVAAVIIAFLIMLMTLTGYLISKREDEVVIYAGDSQNDNIEANNKNLDTNKKNIDAGENESSGKEIEKGKAINENEATTRNGVTSGSEASMKNEVITGNEVSAINEEIKVYIIGCVNNPGIVTLKKGQMICEAIEAAGGTTNDADLNNINMVYKLEENVMLNILPKDKIPAIGKNQSSSKDNNNRSIEAGAGIQIIKDEGDSVVYTGGTSDKEGSLADSSKIKKVNINTASIAELDTLPGIGKVSAESIIKYREQYGKFKKIEDIMNVSGIKENKFKKIKEFITVD